VNNGTQSFVSRFSQSSAFLHDVCDVVNTLCFSQILSIYLIADRILFLMFCKESDLTLAQPLIVFIVGHCCDGPSRHMPKGYSQEVLHIGSYEQATTEWTWSGGNLYWYLSIAISVHPDARSNLPWKAATKL